MSHQQEDPLNAVVREEIARLNQFDQLALAALPPSAERRALVGGKQVKVVIWHDVLAGGEHRVVAQATRPVLLGIGGIVCAEGFAVATTGEKRELTQEELSAFS
jgi:hypothetical protein